MAVASWRLVFFFFFFCLLESKLTPQLSSGILEALRNGKASLRVRLYCAPKTRSRASPRCAECARCSIRVIEQQATREARGLSTIKRRRAVPPVQRRQDKARFKFTWTHERAPPREKTTKTNTRSRAAKLAIISGKRRSQEPPSQLGSRRAAYLAEGFEPGGVGDSSWKVSMGTAKEGPAAICSPALYWHCKLSPGRLPELHAPFLHPPRP